MTVITSPWDSSVSLVSPDGRLTAAVIYAGEVGQGAPTHGTLSISNGFKRNGCNPSIIWSDDSQYLAVPEWTHHRDQKLLVIELETNRTGYAPGIFSVLELHSFSGGRIKGIDSPIHEPRQIDIDISNIEWN